MKKFVIKSYAKINLCLDITGVREDGYHLLDMVMLPIELHDSLLVEETPKAIDNFVTLDDFTITDSEYNTVSKALDYLNEVHPINSKFKIELHKVTPVQAGLGGGSSNAAFILKTINEMKQLHATERQLHDIAVRIGADVPFFLKNKPARCTGIGDKVTPIKIKNDYNVLIVKPELGCSTKEVYALTDKMKNWPHGNVDDVIKALEEGDDKLLAKSVFNVLEAPAMELVPEIRLIKTELKELGFDIVLMSGSGSSVFALSTDAKLIKHAVKQLEDRYLTIQTKIIK